MTMKRKFNPCDKVSQEPSAKRSKAVASEHLYTPRTPIAHRVLSKYYRQVTTLRAHLLSQLLKSSKWRRKRLNAVPAFSDAAGDLPSQAGSQLSQHSFGQIVEQRRMQALSKLLDTTLVGSFTPAQSQPQDETVSQDFLHFTQQTRSTLGARSSRAAAIEISQGDIVDFVIGRLFYSIYPRERYPPHMLCHGYNRTYQHNLTAEDQGFMAGINGLDCMFPNPYASALKSNVWQQLLPLVSKDGDAKIMLDLLLHCGIFVPLETGTQNFYQVSGRLISNILPEAQRPEIKDARTPKPKKNAGATSRSPGEITFVRNRIMHGRPALNRFNETRFGLPQIHVLNKFGDASSISETRHVAMYVFPRQFGLHNVFTSTTDRRETAHRFKDYTLREAEIRELLRKTVHFSSHHIPVPKRLRGHPLALIQNLRQRHQRCSYTELLKHYCGIPLLDGRPARKSRRRRVEPWDPQPPMATLGMSAARKTEEQLFVDFATPPAQVSAYCRSVMANVLPLALFGVGTDGLQNRKMFMRCVDTFVKSTRFEKTSLHSLLQGQKLSCIDWLEPSKTEAPHSWSMTDRNKREELYLEYLYYTFDSILIPLLRSTFCITESTQHGNRVFYFRHDAWRALTEPSIREIKRSTFTELSKDHVAQMLKHRRLGYGRVRLIPKGTGVRMITNLSRREMTKRNGRTELGRSVNVQLEPVHCMLKCEKATCGPDLRGSILSTDEIYPRLKAFRDLLLGRSHALPKLYFVKVDVKSCFDTIPQEALVALLRKLCLEDAYSKHKHLELRNSESRPRRFLSSAKPILDLASFRERLESGTVSERRGTIFAEVVMAQVLDKDALMGLLSEHVQQNIVKIGKKYCQQRNGIPQGSVLSTLLCSFFYADFEAHHLNYLGTENSLLLRLIDDFLLITTDRNHAVQFVKQMRQGCPEYGIEVRSEKTLTNFSWEKGPSAGVRERRWFPYCGIMIKTDTLELSRDRERRLGASLRDAITAERSAQPGASFVRKTLHAFRVQTKAMLTDTSLNTNNTVLTTLYLNFLETAMKMHQYMKGLIGYRRIDGRVMIGE